MINDVGNGAKATQMAAWKRAPFPSAPLRATAQTGQTLPLEGGRIPSIAGEQTLRAGFQFDEKQAQGGAVSSMGIGGGILLGGSPNNWPGLGELAIEIAFENNRWLARSSMHDCTSHQFISG